MGAWEGKDTSVSIQDFTQHVYSEAAEALMNKATAEGLPPGLFLPTVERELARITVDSSERAVNAANVLINKKMLGAALKVQSCFSGLALDAVTSLGLHRFGEYHVNIMLDLGSGLCPSGLCCAAGHIAHMYASDGCHTTSCPL